MGSSSGIREAPVFPSSEGFQKYVGLTFIRINPGVNAASGQARGLFMIHEAYSSEQGRAVTQTAHYQVIWVKAWYMPEAIFQIRKERE